MKNSLFTRTADLRELIGRVRARDAGAAEILQSEVSGRLVTLIAPADKARAVLVSDAARGYVQGLARGGVTESPLEMLWETIGRIEGSDRAEEAGDDRAIERELKTRLAELSRSDPAAYGRMRRFLSGDLPGEQERRPPEEEPRGARGVLARTEAAPEDALTATRDEARELLRWRSILMSLLPEAFRSTRRMMVPGGIACADPDGPRLSWKAIAGDSSPEDEGAFEAHVLSCDHCFEFHYRAHRALRVLRTRRETLLPLARPAREARGGLFGSLAAIFGGRRSSRSACA